MKIDVLEFGRENVHFAAVLKDDVVVHIMHRKSSLVNLSELDKSFPNLRLLKDEDLDDLPILAKQVVEIVVSDDIPIFVVDADK